MTSASSSISTGTIGLPVLKGSLLTERLEEVCAGPLAHAPLDGRRYQNILIPGLSGGEVQFVLLGFIGQALRIRGATVTALMCDELLPACTLRKVDHHERACIRWCHKNSRPFARAMQLPHRWYSEFVVPKQVTSAEAIGNRLPMRDLLAYEYRDIPLGKLIQRSLESYFKVGRVDLDAPVVARQAAAFVASATLLTDISYRVYDELETEKVLLEDGAKIDWGVFREVARRRGIPIDLIPVSPRGERAMVEWDRFPAPSDLLPSWSRWREMPLTPDQDAELDEYIAHRERVPMDGTTYGAGARCVEREATRELLGLPASAPNESSDGGGVSSPKTFAMFPNVGFEAGVLARDPAFDDALTWIRTTVDFIRRHPQHHLVIRAHPGEQFHAAQDSVLDAAGGGAGRIPANVHVLPGDSSLTAHSVIRAVDVCLVFTSTVTAEAVALDTPVILVGGGRHAGRGVTIDVRSPADYLDRMSAICDGREHPVSPGVLGRRYAYAFFFRAAFPTRYFRTQNINVSEITIDSLDELAPGRDDAMDSICRSILLDALPGFSV